MKKILLFSLAAFALLFSSCDTSSVTEYRLDFDYYSSGKTIRCTNKSIGYHNFVWSFGDGSEVSLDKDPAHTYQKAGSYTVTLSGYIDNTHAGFSENHISKTVVIK